MNLTGRGGPAKAGVPIGQSIDLPVKPEDDYKEDIKPEDDYKEDIKPEDDYKEDTLPEDDKIYSPVSII